MYGTEKYHKLTITIDRLYDGWHIKAEFQPGVKEIFITTRYREELHTQVDRLVEEFLGNDPKR